eukprot:13391_1
MIHVLLFGIALSYAETTKYVAITHKHLTWYRARTYCQTVYSSELATIVSFEDESELIDVISISPPQQPMYWIGLNDIDKEGIWQFSDGKSCNDYCWDLWSLDQPNNDVAISTRGEDCAVASVINNTLSFNDIDCTNLETAFICNKPMTYSYLYHDRLNTLSNWNNFDNNSVTISYTNCPSTTTANNALNTFNERKICIFNSNNSFWDGKYEWKYYDTNINVSI